MKNYFGPLGKEWCIYFYVLSMFFLFAFGLSIIGIIGSVVFNKKKIDSMFVANSVAILFNTLLAYFVNRLLNTMCVNSVN
jgi:hypothetical protein